LLLFLVILPLRVSHILVVVVIELIDVSELLLLILKVILEQLCFLFWFLSPCVRFALHVLPIQFLKLNNFWLFLQELFFRLLFLFFVGTLLLWFIFFLLLVLSFPLLGCLLSSFLFSLIFQLFSLWWGSFNLLIFLLAIIISIIEFIIIFFIRDLTFFFVFMVLFLPSNNCSSLRWSFWLFHSFTCIWILLFVLSLNYCFAWIVFRSFF